MFMAKNIFIKRNIPRISNSRNIFFIFILIIKYQKVNEKCNKKYNLFFEFSTNLFLLRKL